MLQWKAAGKSSGGNPKWEADNITDGHGTKLIHYGDEPPTSLEIGAPAKAKAKKGKADSDGAETLAKNLGISVEKARQLMTRDLS